MNAPVIRQEYEAIRAKSLDSDYKLQGSEHAVNFPLPFGHQTCLAAFTLTQGHAMMLLQLHEGSWEWFSYISKGETQDRFAQYVLEFPHAFGIHHAALRSSHCSYRECPVTTALLESIPRLMRDVPFAFTFFSTLEPGSSSFCRNSLWLLSSNLPNLVK